MKRLKCDWCEDRWRDKEYRVICNAEVTSFIKIKGSRYMDSILGYCEKHFKDAVKIGEKQKLIKAVFPNNLAMKRLFTGNDPLN